MQFKSGEWVEAEQIPQQPSMPQQIVSQKISVVLPFIEKEKQSSIELLMRSQEICGRISRTIFLVPFKGIDFGDVRNAAEGAFATVATIQDCEGVLSDWSDRQQMRSASGPNSSFRQVAWFFYLNKKFGSWLWLESDCWPVTSSWLYDLEREYFDAGKPFMGVRMTFPTSGKQYMNGVGIYPWNAIQYAPLLVQSAMWTQHPEYEVGFDVAGGNDVLNHAHMSRRIQLTGHLSKIKDSPRPETSLCHGRPDLPVPVLADEPHERGVLPSGNESSTACGEARESTHGLESRQTLVIRPKADAPEKSDSRGGQTDLSGGLNGGNKVDDVIQSLPPAQEFAPIPKEIERMIEHHRSSSQNKEDASEYGAVSRQIRNHVEGLVQLWGDSPSRKVLIVKELRKAKLVPKHFR